MLRETGAVIENKRNCTIDFRWQGWKLSLSLSLDMNKNKMRFNFVIFERVEGYPHSFNLLLELSNYLIWKDIRRFSALSCIC